MIYERIEHISLQRGVVLPLSRLARGPGANFIFV